MARSEVQHHADTRRVVCRTAPSNSSSPSGRSQHILPRTTCTAGMHSLSFSQDPVPVHTLVCLLLCLVWMGLQNISVLVLPILAFSPALMATVMANSPGDNSEMSGIDVDDWVAGITAELNVDGVGLAEQRRLTSQYACRICRACEWCSSAAAPACPAATVLFRKPHHCVMTSKFVDEHAKLMRSLWYAGRCRPGTADGDTLPRGTSG